MDAKAKQSEPGTRRRRPRFFYFSGSGSAAAIGLHPLHPMVVPIPIGALLFAFGFDLAFVFTLDPFFARGSLILIGVGLAGGALAGVLGMFEMLGVGRARTMARAWAHGIINIVALMISLASFLIRYSDPATAVIPAGILMSGVVVVLLAISGWLGGDLVYRHGVGVSPGVGSENLTKEPDYLPDGRPDIGKS